MAGRPPTVDEKMANWAIAYQQMAANISPQELRDQLTAVINTPIPQDPDGLITYTARMNATMALARLVSANDRAAAIAASMLVSSGIRITSLDIGDDT